MKCSFTKKAKNIRTILVAINLCKRRTIETNLYTSYDNDQYEISSLNDS